MKFEISPFKWISYNTEKKVNWYWKILHQENGEFYKCLI